MEKNVIELLDSLNIKYEYQKQFYWLGKQTLDFYLTDHNIAIECQGMQHFKLVRFGGISHEKAIERYNQQIIRDKNKFILCEENGVKILYYSNVKEKNEYNILTTLEELQKELINNKV